MVDQRRRRWANVVPTLGECLVFTDYVWRSESLWISPMYTPSEQVRFIMRYG